MLLDQVFHTNLSIRLYLCRLIADLKIQILHWFTCIMRWFFLIYSLWDVRDRHIVFLETDWQNQNAVQGTQRHFRKRIHTSTSVTRSEPNIFQVFVKLWPIHCMQTKGNIPWHPWKGVPGIGRTSIQPTTMRLIRVFHQIPLMREHKEDEYNRLGYLHISCVVLSSESCLFDWRDIIRVRVYYLGIS